VPSFANSRTPIKLLYIDQLENVVSQRGNTQNLPPLRGANSRSVAAIIFTSGSTGK
jgi:long-subunit acyl-CoA synthetase (AMP-forming)